MHGYSVSIEKCHAIEFNICLLDRYYFIWALFFHCSYGSWIYNYLCNQCLSPLMMRVRISIRARCTTLYDKVCQWLATGRWFSLGPPVSSTNKTDCHNITEILLKVALNTVKQTNKKYISPRHRLFCLYRFWIWWKPSATFLLSSLDI